MDLKYVCWEKRLLLLKSVALFLLLLPVSAPMCGIQGQQAPGASPFLSPDHWAHGALARLHGAGLLPEGFDPGTRSVSRVEAFHWLTHAMAEAEEGPPPWEDVATAYRERLAEEFPGTAHRASGGAGTLTGDVVLMGGVESRRNDLLARHDPDGSGDARTLAMDDLQGPVGGVEVGLHLPPSRVSLAGHGTLLLREGGARASELYGVALVDRIGVWAGRRRIGLGLSDAGSMVVTGEAPFTGAGLFLSEGVRLPGALGHLGTFRFETFISRRERMAQVESPWFFGLRTSLAPHARVRIGLNRGTVFGGDGERVPPATLDRVLKVLAGIDTADEGANFEDHIASADFWFLPPLGALPLALYGEFGVEDLQRQKDEMPAVAVGARLAGLPRAPWLSLGFERTSFGASEGIRIPWYDHRVFGTWTDGGRLMAHELGGEGRELRAYGTADLWDARLHLGGRGFWRRRTEGNLYAPEWEGSSRGVEANARWHLTPSFQLKVEGVVERGDGWNRSTGFLGARFAF